MKSLALSLSKISPEFLIDQHRFLPDLSYTFSQYLITCLTAVRHEVNNLESSVVVQELELAINLALLLLWIFYVFVLSYVCYVFVRICLYVLCGHLLGKG